MKYYISILLCLFLFQGLLQAQETKFNFNTNIGIGSPILNNGTCYHVGINPSYDINRFIALETQASYIYTNVTGAFLTGAKSTSSTFSLLGGLRVYFAPPEKNLRPYFNFLIGGVYVDENNQNGKTRFLVPNFSTGLFMEYKKIVTGVCYDPFGNAMLKLGYNF